MWKYLVKNFYNAITSEEREDLSQELAVYRLYHVRQSADVEVDEWWAKMADEKDDEGQVFPVLSGFALALCTMYNGSSESERDFSKQNLIYEDSKKCNTSQKSLQNKLAVMCAVDRMGRECKKCEKAIADKKEAGKTSSSVVPYRPTHCHCSLLQPTEDLLLNCSGGKPSRRYLEALDEASYEESARKELSAERRGIDKQSEALDLMKEVSEFRKDFRKQKLVKENEKAEALKRLKVTVSSKSKEPKKDLKKSSGVKRKSTAPLETIPLFNIIKKPKTK